jgi:hypothetical protein
MTKYLDFMPHLHHQNKTKGKTHKTHCYEKRNKKNEKGKRKSNRKKTSTCRMVK